MVFTENDQPQIIVYLGIGNMSPIQLILKESNLLLVPE
jgi:hypothetical protein